MMPGTIANGWEPPPDAAVAMAGLCHRYDMGEQGKRVLDGIDLAVPAGSLVILTGPSGSGKTTLLTLCAGLRSLQEGRLRVLGLDLAGVGGPGLLALRRRIGFIFQNHNLFGALTALENVLLALEWLPGGLADHRARAARLLGDLGLGGHLHHRPDALSGGQRQRVAVARALAHEPPLLLADEPTASLDQQSTREVVGLLRRQVKEKGSTLIMVTHDHRLFEAADRVITLVDGRVMDRH
jgi:putative ABC transport system ATP-binding protein